MLVTDSEHAKPAGVDTGGLVRVTTPVKLFPAAIVSTNVPAVPTGTETTVAGAVIVKSGFVTVRVTTAEWLVAPLVAVTVAGKLPAVVPRNVRVVLPAPVAKFVALSVAVTDGLETVTVKGTGALKLSAVSVTVEVGEPVGRKVRFVGRAGNRNAPS